MSKDAKKRMESLLHSLQKRWLSANWDLENELRHLVDAADRLKSGNVSSGFQRLPIARFAAKAKVSFEEAVEYLSSEGNLACQIIGQFQSDLEDAYATLWEMNQPLSIAA
jgi:hypothetical protein